jgi:hypothetical protein
MRFQQSLEIAQILRRGSEPYHRQSSQGLPRGHTHAPNSTQPKLSTVESFHTFRSYFPGGMPPRTSDAGANPVSRQIELRGCPLAAGRQQAPSTTGPGTRTPPSPPRCPRPATTHAALQRNAALRQFAAPRCSDGDPSGLGQRRHRPDNPPLQHPPSPHLGNV